MTAWTRDEVPAATEVDHDVEPGSTEWLWFATGSKAPAIMGVSKYTTRLGLWRQMTGKEPPQAPNVYMEHGTAREPIIREGTESFLECPIWTPRMLVSNANPRHAYSADGIIPPHNFGPARLWECKAPQNIDLWGEAGTDQIDPQYYPQVQWGLYVTGMASCMVTLEPHRDFIPLYTADYFVSCDGAYIAELVAAVDEFLECVDADTEPVPLGAIVVADPDDIDTIRRWNKNNAQRLEFEKDIKADRVLIDRLGENASALITPEGEVLCHWSETVKQSASTDWAAVEAGNPEAVDQARVTSVDRKRLAELVPDAVRANTSTSTTTTRRLLMGGAK